MLILERNIGQAVFIGEHQEIKITILRAENGRAKISIEAPKEIPIERDDVKKPRRPHQK